MRKRRGKRLISNMGMICLVTIVSVNLLGVGYGMWSDSLGIETNIETGNAEVEFESLKFSDGGEIEELKDIILSLSPDNRALNVTGSCYESTVIRLSAVKSNIGSIPLIFDEDNNTSDAREGISITSQDEDGINITINGLSNQEEKEELIQEENEVQNGGASQYPREYKINKTIYFKQKGRGGWNDKLELNVSLQIIRFEEEPNDNVFIDQEGLEIIQLPNAEGVGKEEIEKQKEETIGNGLGQNQIQDKIQEEILDSQENKQEETQDEVKEELKEKQNANEVREFEIDNTLKFEEDENVLEFKEDKTQNVKGE